MLKIICFLYSKSITSKVVESDVMEEGGRVVRYAAISRNPKIWSYCPIPDHSARGAQRARFFQNPP
eukprot:TRINITY_DN2505_c0_g1_i1.p1 TRINITY_DN2505_c0_g1~~TRINITY_DN2505_c0_g1_i1.p1  ORF type:complete len:66 (+),score=2.90 TRINITY_DN2505_c0_g1_i1:201-398(+)